MHSLRPAACVATTLVAALCGAAQPPQQASVPGPTILRATSDLVLVDVIVTDRDNPIHRLNRSRFHIYENGKEQAIVSFDEHQPSAASAVTAAALLPSLPPHTFTNAPVYSPASAVNILLLDALNTPISSQMDVRRQMLEFMGKIKPGTELAIFSLSSRLRMITGFTADAAQLTQALKSPKANSQPSIILDPQGTQALNSLTGDMATIGAALPADGTSNPLSSMQQFEADVTAFQTDQRVLITLNAMQQLARYLSAIPGRKNLIWFSGSFPIVLDADDSLQSPFEAMRNYSEQIHETAELLSASRVAVYPVDARGLMTPPTFDASYTPSSNLVSATVSGRNGRSHATANKSGFNKDNQALLKQTMQEQATMEQIAEETGGHAYLNTNGLKEAVASAAENGANYYTIGYVPAASSLNGISHRITVKVDNGDYKLAYRHSYTADDSEKQPALAAGNAAPNSLIMAATLHGAPPSTQILFKAQVLSATDPLLQHERLPQGPAGELTATLKGPLHRYIMDLRIDAKPQPQQAGPTVPGVGLGFETLPDGSHRAKVEYTLVAYDAEGKRLNYVDVGLQLRPDQEQYARITAGGVPARLVIDLPEGQCYLRVAVHDMTAVRVGSLELPLLVTPGSPQK